MLRESRGFTLIELLVVIAIIGLLSAIVLAALQTARGKSKDAAVLTELNQLASLAELERLETQTYAGLQKSVWATATACASMAFTGNYATKAEDICTSIVAKQGVTGNVFFTGRNGATPDYTKYYSFMARLPGKTAEDGVATYACVGSSGGRYVGPADPDGMGPLGNWAGEGCYANP